MLKPGTRLAVFSIRQEEKNGPSVWTRCGSAWVNKDASLNLYLDTLPISGKLHVREAGEKREAASNGAGAVASPARYSETVPLEVQPVEGHS